MGHFAPARLGNRAYRGTAEVSIYSKLYYKSLKTARLPRYTGLFGTSMLSAICLNRGLSRITQMTRIDNL